MGVIRFFSRYSFWLPVHLSILLLVRMLIRFSCYSYVSFVSLATFLFLLYQMSFFRSLSQSPQASFFSEIYDKMDEALKEIKSCMAVSATHRPPLPSKSSVSHA